MQSSNKTIGGTSSPFSLCHCGVFLTIRNVISAAARVDKCLSVSVWLFFHLDSPATAECIRIMACVHADDLTRRIISDEQQQQQHAHNITKGSF